MTIAIAKALEDGAQAVICASTGNTSASAAAYAARAGLRAVVLLPQGAVALGKLAQARAAGATLLEVRGSFDQALEAALELAAPRHARPRELAQPAPAPGPEDGGVRGRRRARRPTGPPDPPVRRRRQHAGLRPRLRGARAASSGSSRCKSTERAETLASAIRIATPAHRAEAEAAADVVSATDEQIIAAWQDLARARGALLRAVLGGGHRRAARAPAGARLAGRLRDHGPRPQGPGDRRPHGPAADRGRARRGCDRRGRRLRVTARAPATSANVGPGFDCVGVALDLWNELEVTDEGGDPPDPEHLGVRAFGLVAPPTASRSASRAPIPRARGLGSSAAVIALGLVAACRVAGREPDPQELLALGLAARGPCRQPRRLPRRRRLPHLGRPHRPDRGRCSRSRRSPSSPTPRSRRRPPALRFPRRFPHADAAFTAGRAALARRRARGRGPRPLRGRARRPPARALPRRGRAAPRRAPRRHRRRARSARRSPAPARP